MVKYKHKLRWKLTNRYIPLTPTINCDIEVALTHKHIPWAIKNITYDILNQLIYKDVLIAYHKQGFDYLRSHMHEFEIIHEQS